MWYHKVCLLTFSRSKRYCNVYNISSEIWLIAIFTKEEVNNFFVLKIVSKKSNLSNIDKFRYMDKYSLSSDRMLLRKILHYHYSLSINSIIKKRHNDTMHPIDIRHSPIFAQSMILNWYKNSCYLTFRYEKK